MKDKKRRIFLLDGTGAIISTVSLGYLLVVFNEYVGMPVRILQLLASAAGVFALYSLTCFFLNPKKPWLFIRIIGIANLTYSIVTSILIVKLWGQLTSLGILYFVLEILILWALSAWEIKISIKHENIQDRPR